MRNPLILGLAGTAILLGGCASGSGSLMGRQPDALSTARRAPLVVPPDFALVPPTPGAPRPQEASASTQALAAMFGGPAQRSAVEQSALGQAGRAVASPGIRSNVGSEETNVVDKGATTAEIIAAPEGDGQNARAAVPQ